MTTIKSGRRVGIKDVAKAAGVSVTTVSHALNGKGRLPEATRDRVKRVARELGYRPNANARSLVTGNTGILGIAVSTSPNVPFGLADFDYFIQLLNSATTTALRRGRALVVTGPVAERATLEQLNLDGAIVVDPIADDDLVSGIVSRGLPLVTTGRILGAGADENRNWVDNDHIAGTRKILDHLASRGAERVGLVSSPPVTSYTADAIEAYESWCEDRSQEVLIATAEGSLNEGSGFVAANALFDLPAPPDAVYATLDRLALGVLIAARSRDLSVPNDLLVAGCTDSLAGAWAEPPLTALALHPERIGRLAVEMLIDLVESDEPKSGHVLVDSTIIQRESTDLAATESHPSRTA